MDHQQAAEALGELEDRCAVAKQFIPAADEEVLEEAFLAKDPFLDAWVLVEGSSGIETGEASDRLNRSSMAKM